MGKKSEDRKRTGPGKKERGGLVECWRPAPLVFPISLRPIVFRSKKENHLQKGEIRFHSNHAAEIGAIRKPIKKHQVTKKCIPGIFFANFRYKGGFSKAFKKRFKGQKPVKIIF